MVHLTHEVRVDVGLACTHTHGGLQTKLLRLSAFRALAFNGRVAINSLLLRSARPTPYSHTITKRSIST